MADQAKLRNVEIRPFVHPSAANDANEFESGASVRPAKSILLKTDRLWRYGGGWLTTLLLNPDVLFCPSFTSLYIKYPVPVVTTIHDLTPYVAPVFTAEPIVRKLRFQLASAVRNSRHIIVDSESCREDLVRTLGIPAERCTVAYLGYDKSRFNTIPPPREEVDRLKDEHGLSRPYLFHHGLMQPRKNIKRLIQAYSLLLSNNRDLDIDLVLAGQLEWGKDELMHEAKKVPTAQGRVVFTGPVSEDELSALLKGATLSVIPSLYEGFCLPMVEAMACGVATVCSSTSCLPEVSGGVLRYFDPESVDEIGDSVTAVLRNDDLRAELGRKGRERAQQFDWHRTAERTLDTLLAVARDLTR